MKTLAAQLAVLTAFILVFEYARAFDSKAYGHLPHFIMGRPLHGLRPPPITRKELQRMKSGGPTGDTMIQPVDHFSEADTRMWNQRYYYNHKWYKPGGPMFLLLGGESPDDGGWTVREGIDFLVNAAKFNADVYDIEHRFYGKSRPFPTQSTENLKYLTIAQAIEDVANFIKFINAKLGLQNPKWIVFGGSYSGNLAVWLREKHPELVAGAVGSSAPVLAKYDYYEYLEVVEASLRTHSDKCADRLGEVAQAALQLIWTQEGRQNLTSTFSLYPPMAEPFLRYKDIQNFFASTFGNFLGSVQYNRVNNRMYRNDGGIPEICAIMTNDSNIPIENAAAANRYITEFYSGAPFQYTLNHYDTLVSFLKIDTYDETGDSSARRSWIWQVCSELGYFQTTDRGGSIFGIALPINMHIDICTDTFGDTYRAQYIENKVRETNKLYGGRDNLKATNVVLPNGNIDPWHALGRYATDIPSSVPYLSDGTAHCADMYEVGENDKPGLAVVRKIISDNIAIWLNGSAVNERKKYEKQTRSPMLLKQFKSKLRAAPLNDFHEEMRKPSLESGTGGLPSIPWHGFLPHPPVPADLTGYPEGIFAGTIEQPLDHFDANNHVTWNQRHWINAQYYQTGGPQFLFLGGESPANLKWLTTEVQVMRSARKFNATVFMLEHRFFGGSRPTPNLSTPNLKYLTSKQALADIARYIEAMNEEYGIINPKWVIIGGSYSGSLAAWFRQMYPHLAIGAIASSAPIDLKADFYDYLLTTGNSIRDYNAECADIVYKAFNLMRSHAMTVEGRKLLTDTFNVQPPLGSTDDLNMEMQMFFSNIFSIFERGVQYSGDNNGVYAYGGGIKEMCQKVLPLADDPIQATKAAFVYIMQYFGDPNATCTTNYNLMIAAYSDIRYDSPFASSRGWYYLVCSELGFFQSTDIGENIFGGPTPINIFMELCSRAFGDQFTSKFIFNAVEQNQKFYGGRDGYTGTNVVFLNGKVDNWHAAGKYDGTGSVVTHLIEGAAHCADMYPPRAEDVPGLAPARALIDENIKKWIEESSNPDKLPMHKHLRSGQRLKNLRQGLKGF